jgi:GNAT superfamily N-acetyltransferase
MPRIIKRAREDEINSSTVTEEIQEDPLITIRKRAIRQNPTLTANAKESLKIAVLRDTDKISFSSSSSSSSSTSISDTSWWSPVFTHQLFPLEKVFGYKNPLVRIIYSDPDLRISVQGNAESVKAEVTIPNPSMNGKLVRVSADNLHTCLEKALPPAFPAYLVDAHIANHSGSPPLRKPMFFPEEALPLHKQSSSSTSSSSTSLSAVWKPFGKCISTFQVPSKTGNTLRTFSIYRWKIAESVETQAYHERASTLAVHLIETASAIDVTDQRWTCFGLYEELSSSSYSFAGYATVFRFVSPLRKLPKGGDGIRRVECVRLSQLIVLPPFQRLGLGMKLLFAIQNLADEVNAYEITIESPCEEMATLRDAFDIRRAFSFATGIEGSTKLFGSFSIPNHWKLNVQDSEIFLKHLEEKQETSGEWVDEESIESLRSTLRITLQQARRCFEALCLSRIDFFGDRSSSKNISSNKGSASSTSHIQILRSYRLLQKKRFYLKGADVRALPNVEDRKEVLEDRYRLLESSYLGALAPLLDPVSQLPIVNRQDVLASQTTWLQRRSAIEAENEKDEEEEE